MGLKGFFAKTGLKPQAVPVDDPGIYMDADTPEDYRRLVAYEREKREEEAAQ